MSDKAMEILLEISKKEEELTQLNRKINSFSEEVVMQREKKQFLEEENNDLIITHQLCLDDIKNYKEQIKELELDIKKESERVLNLRKENLELKKKYNIKEDKEKDEEKEMLKKKRSQNLAKILGKGLIKKYVPSLSKEISKEIQKQNIPKNILDKNIKIKEQYELQFKELKKKFNKFHDAFNEEKKLIKEYKIFIGQISEQIKNLFQNLHISYNGVKLNLDEEKENKNFEEIFSKIDSLSDELKELKDYFDTFENLIKNENIFNTIQKKLDFINNKEYLDQKSLENNIQEIKNLLDEINGLKNIIEENRKNSDKKNNIILEKINELKLIQEEYKKKNIKRKESIKKSVINNKSNTDNKNQKNYDINKSLRKKNNPYLNNDNKINQSIILRPKDLKKKEELFKTINLFKEDINEDEQYESIIIKNWHETCYIYDDYDLYDVYYNIKAIKLDDSDSYYDYLIDLPNKCKIEFIMADGINQQFKKKYGCYHVNLNIKNLETRKIHLKYKNFNKPYNKNLPTYEEYYEISSKLKRSIVKFRIINKSSYDIIKFDDLFLVRNEKNKNEIEYVWGGRVPPGGKSTQITFTKKESRWIYNFKVKVSDLNRINQLKIYVPICFNEGNNNIIDINFSNQDIKDLSFDEEAQDYIVKYENLYNNEIEFNLKIEFMNKSRDNYFISISDEEIEKLMPKEDIRDKSKLKNIAEKIIKDFDNEHKNSEFEFLDFMKIGWWVNENIKYDLSYSGKVQYTAMDIYNMKTGVCHHFTRLSNALLYSLGYKVIYAVGYCYNISKYQFDDKDCHAWSLIKIGNIWYPFDSTYGIFSGKLPINHVFRHYYYRYICKLSPPLYSSYKYEWTGTLVEKYKYNN